jgi:predicted transcriptional regulator
MKTITIKTDEEFFSLIDRISRELNEPKSRIIKRAVLEYAEKIEREKLLRKMEKAAKKTVQDKKLLEEVKIWEDTVSDGL